MANVRSSNAKPPVSLGVVTKSVLPDTSSTSNTKGINSLMDRVSSDQHVRLIIRDTLSLLCTGGAKNMLESHFNIDPSW